MRFTQCSALFLLGLIFETTQGRAQEKATVTLRPTMEIKCQPGATHCREHDALVFVHGIFGSAETFENGATGFRWPENIDRSSRPTETLDVFQLEYHTRLISWARSGKDDFVDIAKEMFAALKPLRSREYRSIGFIAHSLGGIFVSAYLVQVKSLRSTAGFAQHAYVITLATPYSGSQIASIASALKSILLMKDDLLATLKKNDRTLEVIELLRSNINERSRTFECRPTHFHIAVETEPVHGISVVVDKESASRALSRRLASSYESGSRYIEFERDHARIAKPEGKHTVPYRWVDSILKDELNRIQFSRRWRSSDEYRYCDSAIFKPE